MKLNLDLHSDPKVAEDGGILCHKETRSVAGNVSQYEPMDGDTADPHHGVAFGAGRSPFIPALIHRIISFIFTPQWFSSIFR